MSNTVEIEKAIAQLSAIERDALESRLLTRRFGLDYLAEDARVDLLSSLAEAERDLDSGRGYSAGELRLNVSEWARK